LINNITS